MKTFIKIALASALLGGAANYALAQQAADQSETQSAQVADAGPDGQFAGHHTGHHGGRGHGGRGGGRVIDTNGDGIISEDEAAALADSRFNQLDANRDGALSESEFTTPAQEHQHWWSNLTGSGGQQATNAADELKARKDKFAALDADKNGSVSKAEFLAEAKARFAALDPQKTGKVNVWDFRAQN